MINHLKMALWHLRQARLIALQVKFLHIKYLDLIIYNVEHVKELKERREKEEK